MQWWQILLLTLYSAYQICWGGTPANVVSRKLLDGGQFDLYAGMNMPMVIGFLNGVLLGEDVDYVEFGRSNLVHVNSLLTSSEDDEDEWKTPVEFFSPSPEIGERGKFKWLFQPEPRNGRTRKVRDCFGWRLSSSSKNNTVVKFALSILRLEKPGLFLYGVSFIIFLDTLLYPIMLWNPFLPFLIYGEE